MSSPTTTPNDGHRHQNCGRRVLVYVSGIAASDASFLRHGCLYSGVSMPFVVHAHTFGDSNIKRTHRCQFGDCAVAPCEHVLWIERVFRHRHKLPCRDGVIYYGSYVIGECPMKRPDGSKSNGVPVPGLADQAAAKMLPLLVEHMTCDAYEDGTKRQRSTVTLFVEDGNVKACLNDRECERSLFRSAGEFLSALEAIEKALKEGDESEWRPWNKKRSKR